MGAAESQPQQREEDDEFVTHMADEASNNREMNLAVSSSASATSTQTRQQHPLLMMQPLHNSSQSQPQLNQLEHQLAQAKDELNAMRRARAYQRKAKEQRKSEIRVNRTEPATSPNNATHAAGIAAPAALHSSAFSHSQFSSPNPVPSHAHPPRPPSPPPAKVTSSEATLAYLIQSLQSNSQHQHIDVIQRQIDLLKEKMDEFRREKEKEAEEKRREEVRQNEWRQTMNDITPNVSDSISIAASSLPNPTTPPDVIEATIPDAKKARHESDVEPIAAAPSSSSEPVFQQQTSPDFARSQFQQIRDTIARDEVYCYPDDDDDQMQGPPVIQQDEQDDQQEPTNYDAIYTRMSEIIQQQNTDCDADMTGESIPMLSDTSIHPPQSALTAITPSPLAPPSVLTVPSPMINTADHLVPPPSFHPHVITRTELSGHILKLCLSEVIKLEDKYLTGTISYDQMRFDLAVLHNVLTPQHERELVEHFERLRIKKNDTTTLIPSSHSIINGTLSSQPTYNDSFIPDLAVDDDSDGCPRLRTHVFERSIQIHGTTQLKRKKHSKDSHSIESSSLATSAPPSNLNHNPSNPSSSLVTPAPTTSLSPTNGGPFSLCRMYYVNHAFERVFGFTQADIKGMSYFDLTLRKDHAQASHRLRHKWWSDKAIDSIMYEVRIKKDGTFIYCLVHRRVSFLQGKLKQVVISFLPLPVDDEHPMPPFVEGVDLDEDTLLYGYKPRQSQ